MTVHTKCETPWLDGEEIKKSTDSPLNETEIGRGNFEFKSNSVEFQISHVPLGANNIGYILIKIEPFVVHKEEKRNCLSSPMAF